MNLEVTNGANTTQNSCVLSTPYCRTSLWQIYHQCTMIYPPHIPHAHTKEVMATWVLCRTHSMPMSSYTGSPSIIAQSRSPIADAHACANASSPCTFQKGGGLTPPPPRWCGASTGTVFGTFCAPGRHPREEHVCTCGWQRAYTTLSNLGSNLVPVAPHHVHVPHSQHARFVGGLLGTHHMDESVTLRLRYT